MNKLREQLYELEDRLRQVHLYDRTNSVPRLIKDEHLQQFIFENFANRKMALCSRGQPCRRRICPWCALSRVAAMTRADTSGVARKFSFVVEIVLSTPSQPTLAGAWAIQHSVRSKFMENAWLSSRVAGWLRETEATVEDSGWHVHDNYLLFLDSEDTEVLEAVGVATVDRWLLVASRLGIGAGRSGQFSAVRTNVHERLLYVTKGLMAQKRDRKQGAGFSPADVLAMWVAGEVRGMEWWRELEALFESRRRWRAKGGDVFRSKESQ